MMMLRLRYALHFNAILASALIGSFLLAFVGISSATSAGAEQFPTVHVPGKQIVTVFNETSGKMTLTGHIQLNLFNKPTANVTNKVYAIGSCVSCETLGVAVQVNVVSSLTSAVNATNSALALNYSCRSCLTEADALQVWILAPESTVTVPSSVKAFVAQMNSEFSVLENQPNLTPNQAVAGVNQIMAQNSGLIAQLITRFAATTATNTPS